MKNITNKQFEQVFRDNYSKLCVYAQRFVVDYNLAEEMVSDAFYKFYNKKEKLDLKYSISNYLFKMVYNNCIDYLKYKKRISNVNIIDETGEKNEVFTYTVDQLVFYEQDESEYNEQLNLKLQNSLNLLPDQCRQVIKMRKIDGLSHTEISQELNISKKTIETQIYRGMKKIKASLLFLLVWFLMS